MDRNAHVREAQMRAIDVYARRPERARVVNAGSAELRDGLRCVYLQDGHSLTVDMPSAVGGTEEGPSPGYFGRAAICGCLAIGIKMTAARENLHLDAVRVGIEQDWDNRGILGEPCASPVPSDTRIAIEVETPEAKDEVHAMIAHAIAADPWFLGVPGCATREHRRVDLRPGRHVMEARLQLRVQRYGWDAVAAYYHDGWEAQLRPAHDRLLEMAAVTVGQRVIETACGSGLVTLRLVDQVGPTGHILATDLSQGMIDALRARLDGASLSTVAVERMPTEKLDVAEGAFDAAVCALGLMYTPDPAAAVAEMARAVAPGGIVAATVWGERRNCGWAEVFPIVDARVASEVCPMFFGTGAPGALRRIFEEAGLDRIREHRQSETLDFPSDHHVVEAVLLGGPVALAVKRFGEAVWADVREDFLASVAEYREGDRRYRIPGEFVRVTGVRPSN